MAFENYEQTGGAFWHQIFFIFLFQLLNLIITIVCQIFIYLSITINLFISAKSPSGRLCIRKSRGTTTVAAHLANSYGLTYHKLTRLKMMSLRFEITHVPRNTFRVMARNMKRSLALNLWKGINLRDMAARWGAREKAATTLSMRVKKSVKITLTEINEIIIIFCHHSD